MTNYRRKTCIHIALLTVLHFINSSFHIVVDPTLRNTTSHIKCMIMGIEQHLMGLQQICTDKERTAVTQFEVGALQPYPQLQLSLHSNQIEMLRRA